MKIIDVSKWQGNNIDWDKAKAAGIEGVMLRAGYGRYASQKDPTFERNYTEAKRVGLAVGAYWYSYATTATQAAQEASIFLGVLVGKQFELPVAYDIEYEPGILALTNAQRTQLVKTFLSMVEQAGYYGILYASTDFIANKLNYKELTRYDVWAAQYGLKCTCPLPYGMWQYSSTGKVDGIPGNVDLDTGYKDYPTIIKGAGKNGFEKEENIMYSDTLKIGPVSGGDRKAMAALAESLNLPHVDAGDYIIVGPASDGDRKQIVAKAQSLGLGVENYLPPEPEAPEEPETPETPDVPDMEFDEVMFMLVKLDSKLDRVLEKLELVQQALEDPAAQQVLDKLEKAGAVLVE